MRRRFSTLHLNQAQTSFLSAQKKKTKHRPFGTEGLHFNGLSQRFWRFWRLNWTWAPSQSSTGLAPSHLHFWSWQAPSSLQLGWHLKTWKIWHQKPQAQSKDRKARAQSFYSFVTCNASALILLITKFPIFQFQACLQHTCMHTSRNWPQEDTMTLCSTFPTLPNTPLGARLTYQSPHHLIQSASNFTSFRSIRYAARNMPTK